MTLSQLPFSVRDFLKEREALLVHFSTQMARDQSLMFPEDLKRAMGLTGVPLSFSTIRSNDVGPFQTGLPPETTSAGGSVGMIVDN